MNALDTNVLAPFFIDDPDDPQTARQRPAAVTAVSARACVSIDRRLAKRALSPVEPERVLTRSRAIRSLVEDAIASHIEML